jgi:predicted nucleotidyltransferase
MATIEIPNDFKEFFRSLNKAAVEYLLVGGYAVSIHGYVRPTADLDVWVATTPNNADRVMAALTEFGFGATGVHREWLLEDHNVIRMGVPPLRLEIQTSISGMIFSECYTRAQTVDIDGVPVKVISLEDLKRNKKAAGRLKDLADLDYLP